MSGGLSRSALLSACSQHDLRGKEIMTGKTSDGEIDFVAVRQNEKNYVHVTQKISSERTKRRASFTPLEVGVVNSRLSFLCKDREEKF